MQSPLSDAALRDTLAAVFRAPEFRRSVRETVWQRFIEWLAELLAAFRAATSDSEVLFWSLAAALVLILAALVARAAYASSLRRASSRRGRRRSSLAGGGSDAWSEAERLAAAGNYTDAAHALYRALLEVVARRERLRVHPSKTAGDYARELRARSSALFGQFRQFARSYEVVIYGLGHCDRARYDQLVSLASGIMHAHG